MIADNIGTVQARIRRACVAAGRPVESVTLLAVSKRFPPEAVREAAAAGQRCFGENQVQEGVDKIVALRASGGPLEWHLIGPLQSNKTAVAAAAFDWIESVDRLKIAQRLSTQRPPDAAALDVCIQVNVGDEATKSGVAPGETLALAKAVAGLPRLRLRGIMGIPAPTEDVARQRAQFRALRECFDRCLDAGLAVDTLSMGMSADLEAAIAEGSTEVRVGSAIFGVRK